jgi:WD40 repeat protein
LATIKDKRKKLPANPYPTAMCYGSDARNLVIANTLGDIIIYDTKEYLPKAYIQGEGPAKSVALSSNNYFIASAVGNDVAVWNFQTHQLRTKLPMGAEVKEVAFSPDASMLAVITADNKVTIFDTKTWTENRNFTGIGSNLSCVSFHPDGKYISVVDNGSQIIVLNHITGRIEIKFNNSEANSIVASLPLSECAHDLVSISMSVAEMLAEVVI